MRINVIQSVSDLSSFSGGPSRSISSLADSLQDSKVDVSIITPFSKQSLENPIILPSNKFVKVLKAKRNLYGTNFMFDRSYYQLLSESIKDREHTIIHDNGIWLSSNYTVSKFARNLSLPLVISTHGMLQDWSIRHKYFKKKIAWFLYQRNHIKSASLIHATSLNEAESIKKISLNVPIAIIPNGVKKPKYNNLKQTLNLRKFGINLPEDKILLFIGRIHPVKGLMNLLKTWKSVKPFKNNWKLVIAGPSDSNYSNILDRFVKDNSLEKNVIFLGPIEGDDLSSLYRQSTLFVLPSFTENFGMVVLEALSYGLPVITTKGTPWPQLISSDSGWWVEPNVENLSHAISLAVNLDDTRLHQMSLNAIKLSEKYNWENISLEFYKVYQWLLGKSCKPDSVI